jgi:hypothetical protein
MGIVVDGGTRLCVSGITGREGTFHTLRNRDYGTQVVSGVAPGKGGQDVEGIPVFDTFHAAVSETGANNSFELHDPDLLVIGHRRIRTEDATRGDYLYVVHSFRDGRVFRIAAHVSRDAALADIAERYGGQAWPS